MTRRDELQLLRLALAAHREALAAAHHDPERLARLGEQHARLRLAYERLRHRDQAPAAAEPRPGGRAMATVAPTAGLNGHATASSVPATRGGGGAPADTGGPLTGREREVAALVAAGLTNKEIGRRLCLEEGTVANHVRRARLKLGLASRTQLAVWSTREESAGRACDPS